MTAVVPLESTQMVGSVSQVEQHVTLPGIDTVTSSRALRAPCWAIVLGVHVLVVDDVLSRLLGALLPSAS